jgi:hypothetical protein
MKKLYVFLLIICIVFFAACNGDPANGNGNGGKGPDDFPTWNEWLEHKYGKTFGWDTDNGWDDPEVPMTHNMLAEEYFFSKGLNAGWNLGNTYDWRANPRALQANSRFDAVMAGVRAAGFNVLRLPVSWSSSSENGSNNAQGGRMTGNPATNTVTFESSWLDDVEAAARAAHKAGLVVMINTHHDKNFFRLDLAGACLRDNGPTGPTFVMYTEYFRSLWTQIAERFKYFP